MATPVISNVTVSYPAGTSSLAPGQTATVVVSATDADNYQIAGTIKVTDSGGNSATAPFNIVVADSVTYSATADSGATVVQDPTAKNKFYVTAA